VGAPSLFLKNMISFFFEIFSQSTYKMSTTRNGGLLELVSRGKKDTYFTHDANRSFFNGLYAKCAAFTEEIYVTQPRNAAAFGTWIEFPIEHRGDLVRDFKLRLTLPTWLPSAVAAVNPTGIVSFFDGSTLGYVNGVGYYALERIQLYNDQILLQELWGEELAWRQAQLSSDVQTIALGTTLGFRYESTLAVGRSATLPTLYVPIPLVELPLVALSGTRLRLRVLLKPLEQLIVSSTGGAYTPPWGLGLSVQATRGGVVDTSQVILARDQIAAPSLSLEATHVYVPKDIRSWLQSRSWQIPLQQMQQQLITLEDNQFNLATTTAVTLPLRLDLIGAVTQLLFAVQSQGSVMSNLLNVYTAANGSPFLTSVRLNIANIDRVQSFSTDIYQYVTPYWKHVRTNMDSIYTMPFGGVEEKQPAGTLNLTRATRPVFYITLNSVPYDYRSRGRTAYLRIYAQSWNVVEIENGVCRVMFAE
jgi:hypothetical protein